MSILHSSARPSGASRRSSEALLTARRGPVVHRADQSLRVIYIYIIILHISTLRVSHTLGLIIHNTLKYNCAAHTLTTTINHFSASNPCAHMALLESRCLVIMVTDRRNDNILKPTYIYLQNPRFSAFCKIDHS